VAQKETTDLERGIYMLQHLDATQIIEGLCERLQDTEFEDYNSQDELLLDIGDIVKEYIHSGLGEFASVCVRGKDKGKSKSVWAYGTDFWPDITVEVRELPTIAIEVRLAKKDNGLAESVASAIGKALIYSVQYSHCIAFVLDRTESDLGKHWFDSEVEDRLWDNHRISLVIVQ